MEFQGSLKKLSKKNLEKLKKRIIEDGFNVPFFVWDHDGMYKVLDGHQRLRALQSLREDGWDMPLLPVAFIEASDEADARKKLLAISSQYGEFDASELSEWLDEIGGEVAETLRLVDGEVEALLDEIEEGEETIGDDNVDEPSESMVTKIGDIWELGPHRLLCGDSTLAHNIERLMDGEKADMVFTDPPYGMKKEADGILNDNLNFDDLLEFNRQWIPFTFDALTDVGSWYCWGIDEPLMDIYSEILKPMIRKNQLTFRNLITWDKGNGMGQLSEGHRMFATADEKCLFAMKGVQGFNNNADNYWEGWEPIRKYLDDEMKRCGGSKNWKAALGNHMGKHFFTRSQWEFPTEGNYQKLQKFAEGEAFKKEYEELKKEYEELKKEYEELKKEFYSTRAYFNNTHDNMNSVWHFDRTNNEEREDAGNHATPKPVALCARAVMSSSREDGIVLDVFGGSGSTLIACERTGRQCYMMELDPGYCDVIVRRYIKFCTQNDRDMRVLLNGEPYDYAELT